MTTLRGYSFSMVLYYPALLIKMMTKNSKIKSSVVLLLIIFSVTATIGHVYEENSNKQIDRPYEMEKSLDVDDNILDCKDVACSLPG